MSATAEHLASLDARVAEIRAAWDKEKQEMRHHIMTIETELAIRTKLHDEAIIAKEMAMKTAATFVAKLAMCTTVLEEAREMAIAAGLYHTTPKPDTSQTDIVMANMDKINEIVKGEPTNGAVSS